MNLPLKVSASKAVARRETYEGVLPVAGFRRLEGLVADDRGEIRAQLSAVADEAGNPHLRGEISGHLRLSCQRCLKAFDWPLQAPLALRLVKTETEEGQVMHEAEPYLVSDDSLPLREIVEDELLLALPMMPRCKSCENARPSKTAPAVPGAKPKDSRRENPFVALKSMKFDRPH